MPAITARLLAASQLPLALLPPVHSAAAATLHTRAQAILASVPPGRDRQLVLAGFRAALGQVAPSTALAGWLALHHGANPASSAPAACAAASAWLQASVAAAWPP